MTRPESNSTVQLTIEETQGWGFLSAAWWRSWVGTADTMRKSARVLWVLYQKERDRQLSLGTLANGQSFDLDYEWVALMLMGMALENLLKAVLLVRDPSLVGKRKISNKLKTHDLLRLFAHVGIELKNASEIQYVETLTRFVEWQGRYPGPIDAKNMGPVFRLGGNWDTFNEIYERTLHCITPQHIIEADEAFAQRSNEFWEEIEKSRQT